MNKQELITELRDMVRIDRQIRDENRLVGRTIMADMAADRAERTQFIMLRIDACLDNQPNREQQLRILIEHERSWLSVCRNLAEAEPGLYPLYKMTSEQREVALQDLERELERLLDSRTVAQRLSGETNISKERKESNECRQS